MSTTALELMPREFEAKVSDVVANAKAITITTPETYTKAALFVKEYVNPILKELDNTFDPIIDKAHKAHKEALEQKARHAKPLTDAKFIATQKCKAYEDAQEMIRQCQQREAEEAARKREEEERLSEAVAADEAGAAPEEVAAIIETPLPVAPVRVAPTFERVKGVTRDRPFSAQVTAKLLLVRYVAENPQYLNLLEPNMPALNALARAQQNLLQIPGVKSDRF